MIGLVPRLRCGFVGRMRLLPIDIDGRTASGLSRWLGCGSRSVAPFPKRGGKGEKGGKGGERGANRF